MEVLPITPQAPRQLDKPPSPLSDTSPTLINSKKDPFTSTRRAAYRRSLHLSRSFSPLTPILASPHCGSSADFDSDEETKPRRADSSLGRNADPAALGLGHNGKSQPHLPALPTWTSTPPTPPRAIDSQEHPSSHPKLSQTASFSALYPKLALSSRSRLIPKQRRASAPPTSFTKFSQLNMLLDAPPALSTVHTANPLHAATDSLPLVGESVSFAKSNNLRPPSPYPKAVFLIPQDPSDNEDDSPKESPAELPPPAEHDPEAAKDYARRYHALMELLMTEIGYLVDLRVLVTIYLDQLSALASGTATANSDHSASTTPLSFDSVSSASAAQPQSRNSTFVEHAQNSSTSKEKNKRHLLTQAELQTVTRNAGEILQLHEQFVDDLRGAMAPLGFPMTLHESQDYQYANWISTNVDIPETKCIDEAIRVVSTKFAVEASRFNAYQHFCCTHSEAFNLLQRVQQQKPVEWDAFEQRSSDLVLDLLQPNFPRRSEEAVVGSKELSAMLFKSTFRPSPGHKGRSHSLSSLEVVSPTPASSTNHSPTSAHPRKPNGSRLGLMGYLIKPIQRICKYPLLLEQLKMKTAATDHDWSRPSQATYSPREKGPDVNVIAESASQAMRHVATLVDEAERRQTVTMQSSLIASRIHLAWAASRSSHVHRAFHLLMPNFVLSLGTCVLAGPLDVLHYHASKPLPNPKYLGAFLYQGGYLILVKVMKGKSYEPRHWFSLNGFEVTDIRDDGGRVARLPWSFLLSSNGHHLMLGASCHREKGVWLSCIQQALSGPSRWTNEPASSLHFEGRANALLSDFDRSEGYPLAATHAFSDAIEGAEPRNAMEPPGVSIGLKSSMPRSTSVKSIFSPLSLDTSSIARRSSHATRLQIDRWLEDVTSEPCRIVRSLASQDSELSYGSRQARSYHAGSNSVLSLSRLGRRESVFRSGKKYGGAEALAVPVEVSSTFILRPKALSVPRRKRRPILPTPLPSNSEGDDNSEAVSESPNVPSAASSGTASNYSSIPPSPVDTTSQTPTSPITETTLGRPKRTRSMVENVRGLFYLRSASPVSLTTDISTPDTSEQEVPGLDSHSSCDVGLHIAPALLKWWAKGSLRRRARSSPDVPAEDTIKVKSPPASRSPTPDVPLSASDVDPLPRKSHLNISLLQRFSPFTEPHS